VSHAEYEAELQALRETLPEIVEGTIPSKTAAQSYSIEVATRVLDQYILGKSFSSIARMSEMPSHGTLLRWSRENPEFVKLLGIARTCRAVNYEDKALEEAELLDDPRMVGVAKTKIDAYWKAAEVNDPSVYGKKVSHSGSIDSGGKIVVQVITGFGPLNENLQFPKLNADGTIAKAEPKQVTSEVVHAADGKPESSTQPDSRNESEAERIAKVLGHADSSRSHSDRDSGGV
jgi:hypothetical protein